MSFDDLMLWLVSAMSLTAVVFLLWTLVALIRNSGPEPFAMESETGRHLSATTPRDRGPS
jgi:hypothetical protein